MSIINSYINYRAVEKALQIASEWVDIPTRQPQRNNQKRKHAATGVCRSRALYAMCAKELASLPLDVHTKVAISKELAEITRVYKGGETDFKRSIMTTWADIRGKSYIKELVEQAKYEYLVKKHPNIYYS